VGQLTAQLQSQCLLGLLVTWPVQHMHALPTVTDEWRCRNATMLWHGLLLRCQLASHSVGGQHAGMLLSQAAQVWGWQDAI
jgi:hypothetical protein